MIETPVRRAAQGPISGVCGAFLRVDRGDALYVSDAPRRGDLPEGLIAAYDRIDFDAAENQGLLFVSPRGLWMPRVTDAIFCAKFEDEQSRLLERLLTRDAMDFERGLWIDALKCAEGIGDARALERRIREAAAVCLRRACGGGSLYHVYALYKASLARDTS